MKQKNETSTIEEIREAFNPFSLHAGPRMLMYMYIDEEYYERKRNEYALSRVLDHNTTFQSLYDGYHRSEQAEQDIRPLEAFRCWACGHTGGSMIMVSINLFICPHCHENLAKLFPTRQNNLSVIHIDTTSTL
ncbi:MAG: hypothetical protein RIG61_00820 [Deltaproteobacteria bacterium]